MVGRVVLISTRMLGQLLGLALAQDRKCVCYVDLFILGIPTAGSQRSFQSLLNEIIVIILQDSKINYSPIMWVD